MEDIRVTPYEKPDRVAPENYENQLPPEKQGLNVFAQRLCCMIPPLPAATVADLDSAVAVVHFLRSHGGADCEQLVALYLGETVGVIRAIYGYASTDAALEGLAQCAREVLRSALGLPVATWEGQVILRPGFRHRRDCMLPRPQGGE